MYLNKFLIKKTIIGFCAVAVPAVAIGGYFAISNSDKYRNYYATPTTDTPRGYIDAYKKAVYNGAEVIAAPGFTHKDPILNAFNGRDKFFDNTGFMLYDDTPIPFSGPLNKEAVTHTWSVTFRSDLGSIQAGIAMCQFLNENEVFLEDGELWYGTFGGLPYASVTSFMGGFQKGVEWFNKNVAGKNGMKEVKERKVTFNKYFSGSFSPSDGKDIIEDLITASKDQKKADIIIPVAGPQVWLAQKILITQRAKTVLLGVDSPVEDDPQNQKIWFTNPDGSQVGNGKYVQFSSEKNLARAGDTALRIINNGNKVPESEKSEERYKNFAENGVGGFGTIAVGDIDNGCVGVSDSGKDYFQKALKAASATDPAKDPKYSEPNEMYWKSPSFVGDITDENIEKQLDQFNWYKDELKKEFENVIENKANGFGDMKPINKKDFIKKGRQSDDDKIKVILSGSTSILLDGSFSQSCYRGIVNYLKYMGINMPYPTATYALAEKKRM